MSLSRLLAVIAVLESAGQAGIATNAPPLLKVGIATVDITPVQPVWMQGFAARKAPSTGVFKNLSATCLVFDNGQMRLGLMALDVCKISEEALIAIRAAAAKVGIAPQRMIINSSHTHCGPSFNSKNAAYISNFVARTCSLLPAAVADLKDARLDYALGSSTMGVNRRQLDSKGKAIGMRPEPRKPIDLDVPVLRILGSTNQVRAVVFSYACHPTTLQASCLDIAPDYVGFARDWIAAAYTNCTPVFLQGFGGDVKPRYVSPTGKFGFVLRHETDRRRDRTRTRPRRDDGCLRAAGVSHRRTGPTVAARQCERKDQSAGQEGYQEDTRDRSRSRSDRQHLHCLQPVRGLRRDRTANQARNG